MRLTVLVNDSDLSDAVDAKSLTINKDISSRISTASMTFVLKDVQNTARYDELGTTYDTARYGVDIREMYAIEIRESTFGILHFSGQVSRLQYKRESRNVLRIQCDCSDYTSILDRTVIPSATFTGQSDRSIIQAVVAAYCPTISSLTANIAQILPTVGYYQVESKSVRQVIEEICELSGAEWRVSAKDLFYFLPTAYPAPFGLSSAPDNFTTFGIDADTEYTRDFIKPVNRCTVIGGFEPGGTQINVTYEDPVSEVMYGVQAHTIVDRDITLVADAILRAKVTVEQKAYPEESLTLTTYKDGLDVGQSLPIFHADYKVNGQYIIRSMRLQQVTRSLTRYSLDLGVKPPDEEVLLRQLEARSRRSTIAPTALAAPGSVSDQSISVGGISAGSINSVNTTSLIGLVSSTQISSVNAVSIAGVITAGQIGSINAATIQGAIISSQVADNLIDRLGMYANALRPITAVEGFPLPPLPDPNFPEDSVIFRKDGAVFYTNHGGTWTLTAGSTAIAGKLEFYHIGEINAAQINGVILAAQIGTVNASTIQGSISASQIGSVNASSIAGTVTATQIGSINAATINIGLIQDGQIGTVGAGKLTAGTITATVTMTSPVITGGSISLSAISGDNILISSGGFFIQQSGNPSNGVDLTSSRIAFSGAGGVGNIRATLSRLPGGAGAMTITTATGSNFLTLDGSLGTSGAAGAIIGYLNVIVAGINRKLPYYA